MKLSNNFFKVFVFLKCVCVCVRARVHACLSGGHRLEVNVFLNCFPACFCDKFSYYTWSLLCWQHWLVGVVLKSPWSLLSLAVWSYRHAPPHPAFEGWLRILTQVLVLSQHLVH